MVLMFTLIRTNKVIIIIIIIIIITSSNRRLESVFEFTGHNRKTMQQDLQTGQTGQTSPDQSRSQALSSAPAKQICGGCQMCVPRSTDGPTTSPIKSRLKSVLGSALPTLNAIIIIIIINIIKSVTRHKIIPLVYVT